MPTMQCCGAGPFLTGSGFFFAGSVSSSYKKQAFNQFLQICKDTPPSLLEKTYIFISICFLICLKSMLELRKRIAFTFQKFLFFILAGAGARPSNRLRPQPKCPGSGSAPLPKLNNVQAGTYIAPHLPDPGDGTCLVFVSLAFTLFTQNVDCKNRIISFVSRGLIFDWVRIRHQKNVNRMLNFLPEYEAYQYIYLKVTNTYCFLIGKLKTECFVKFFITYCVLVEGFERSDSGSIPKFRIPI